MDDLILKEIFDGLNKGNRGALVTLTNSQGSTPRKVGSLMAVWEDGRILGSIGGGKIEHEVINLTIEAIRNGEDKQFHFSLAPQGELGMACGGDATGFIKVFLPKEKLIIAGAGHIGIMLNKFGKGLNFTTAVFDDREEYGNRDRLPDADEIIVGDIKEELDKYPITDKTYIVIVTRGHAYDAAALKAVVNSNAAYIGMIGSSAKTTQVFNDLISEGIEEEKLSKVFAPVGLDIANGTPEEIAISILSEILVVKNNKTGKHMKDVKGVFKK